MSWLIARSFFYFLFVFYVLYVLKQQCTGLCFEYVCRSSYLTRLLCIDLVVLILYHHHQYHIISMPHYDRRRHHHITHTYIYVSMYVYAAAGIPASPARYSLRGVRHEGHQRASLYRAQAAWPMEEIYRRYTGQHYRKSVYPFQLAGQIRSTLENTPFMGDAMLALFVTV